MATEIPAQYMSEEAVAGFLTEPRHAIISTTRKDGSPHLSAVWYLYEDEELYIVAMANSVKCRNIRLDPRVGVCVDGGFPDNRSVLIYGTAEIRSGSGDSYEDVKREIFGRYLESNLAQTYIEESDAYGEGALIIVRPDRIVGIDMGE